MSARVRGTHGIWWSTGLALLAGVAIAVAIGFLGSPAGATVNHPASGPPPAELVDGRALGRPDAPVTVEIWSDFQCPACGILARSTEPRFIDRYVITGRARLVYRDYAFLGDESVAAAGAARCAAEQGAFWRFHDYLFANQRGENLGAFSRSRLHDIAGAAGLDIARLDACLATGTPAADVRAETAEGQALGVRSTPTIVVGGQAVAGALTFDQLAGLVEAAMPAPAP